jgi:hypothetical protein
MANTATSSTEDFALDVMRAVAIPRNFSNSHYGAEGDF